MCAKLVITAMVDINCNVLNQTPIPAAFRATGRRLSNQKKIFTYQIYVQYKICSISKQPKKKVSILEEI